MSDATYLVDALREIEQSPALVRFEQNKIARSALARFDADLAAGRVPVIVDREARNTLELRDGEFEDHDDCPACRLVDAYDAATRDTPRSADE